MRLLIQCIFGGLLGWALTASGITVDRGLFWLIVIVANLLYGLLVDLVIKES